MQHLLEDIQADQTKKKTIQQGEDVQEELDCKKLKLRLDAVDVLMEKKEEAQRVMGGLREGKCG